MKAPQGGTRWGAVAAPVVVTIAAVTPGFATGALMEPITDELGVGTAAFGLALACFFAATAVGSPVSAHLIKRLGAAPQLAVAAVGAGTVMVGLGFVSSIIVLGALLAAGGLVNSLVQPAAGRVLGSEVSPGRLSLASSLVQAALVTPLLPAGLLVRFLAEPYGWRTAFYVGGALVALTALASVLARGRKNTEAPDRPSAGGESALSGAARSQILFLWAVGAALGTVGVTATASFFVPIGVASGFSAATAGLLALAAAALAAAVRVGAGLLADRRPHGNVAAVAGMMLVGSAGLGVIALGTRATFLLGALLVVAGLWGWNGLLVASAVRLLPNTPACALGGLQVGFFSGATVAPLVFGALSAAVGIGGALRAAAASAVAAAGAVAGGEELYRRHSEGGDNRGEFT